MSDAYAAAGVDTDEAGRGIRALVGVLAERVDPDALAEIATGLRRGVERAGVEIPGGELAVLPELIRGHPVPALALTGDARGLRQSPP